MTQYKMSDKNTKSNEHIEEQNSVKNAKNGQQANPEARKSPGLVRRMQEKAGRIASQLEVKQELRDQEPSSHLATSVGSTNGPCTALDRHTMPSSQEKPNNLGVDSDSQGSSSNAFAEPPSIGDVHDDLSELSDLEVCMCMVFALLLHIESGYMQAMNIYY